MSDDGNISATRLAALSDKFWGFARDNRFPDAQTSMRRRDYQCKPFRRAWKRYQQWREHEEMPARIAAATRENPYRLMDGILSWDGKVYRDHSYTGQMVELPGADPLRLRRVAGFYADDRHVWQWRPVANSPPLTVMGAYGHPINNPEAVWEYAVVEGAYGKDFRWLDDPWDGLYYSDGRRIYATGEGALTPLPGVQASQFSLYGQCFGRTDNAVFYAETALPLNPAKLQTDGFLIWDDQRLFLRKAPIALSVDGLLSLGEVRLDGRPSEHAKKVSNRDGEYLIMRDGSVRRGDPQPGPS